MDEYFRPTLCQSTGSGLRLGERANLQLQVVLDYTGVTKDAADCKNNAPQQLVDVDHDAGLWLRLGQSLSFGFE